MVQIGFASSHSPSQSLSTEERAMLQSVLHAVATTDLSTREERVLLTSPTEGVGTKPIDDATPVGVTALGLDDEDDDGDSMYSATGDSEDEAVSTEPEDQKTGYFEGAVISERSTSSSSAQAASPSPPLVEVSELKLDEEAPSASTRRRLLPSFLRRNTGQQSSSSLRVDNELDYSSDVSTGATPDTEGSPSRRFARLKGVTTPGAKFSGRVKRPRRRRRTQNEYTYDDGQDHLGLVQIEAKGAQNLPRLRNGQLYVLRVIRDC